MKKEKRGRKPTGRVRTEKLNGALFTKAEKARILEIVKYSGLTQSDCLIKATEYFIGNEERKKRRDKKCYQK